MSGFQDDPVADVPEGDRLDQEREAWETDAADPEQPVTPAVPRAEDIHADPADVFEQSLEVPGVDDLDEEE
ncbi:hypothetical protein [Microbacterium sp. EF45047]|uniref:hypothetical protein n=1 Tax=Microbacterium sp. EF45047 TaxID=2809708 RepID=UPI002349FC8F|nr:hypothetical protein [Microbacterium sp. EF45047]WCM56706.1 hypothetical protein JRG78_05995 [Microbacterium sp. EF45047]